MRKGVWGHGAGVMHKLSKGGPGLIGRIAVHSRGENKVADGVRRTTADEGSKNAGGV